jgi:Dynamin central region/Dynamin family
MGIPGPNETIKQDQRTFTDDVLKIEICGPDKEHLSFIDIPGIFRNPTPGVTTKADMALVRSIVHKYIESPRTIILAVIPANVDIATQEILTIAEDVDPKGVRTLGVLTKPDLVDKGGEENILDLVRGRKQVLNLGYCIVRNRGQQELSSESSDRHDKERAFFNSAPWDQLDKGRVGIPSLKERLTELLVDITRREFPKVRSEIDKRLSQCRSSLQGLGPDRETQDQQLKYLLQMSMEFQRITNAALDAQYARDNALNNARLRLATLVVDRNEKFSNDVWKMGHTVRFRKSAAIDEKEEDRDDGSRRGDQFTTTSDENEENDEIDEENNNDENDENDDSALDQEAPQSQYPELSELLPDDSNCIYPQDFNILDWISSKYKATRGFELGTFNPAILPSLFQEQSRNWGCLAKKYICDIIYLVHDFINQLLVDVCPDERVRANLLSILTDTLMNQYNQAIAHVDFILHVEHSGTALTTNHYFSDNLEKSRLDRVKKALKKQHGNGQSFTGYTNNQQVSLEDALSPMSMSNHEHTVRDIHDILNAYYKVARKRFVDTVCMQGCDFHLITGGSSPLRIFTPLFVHDLSAEQLDMIAGEDPSSKRNRKALEQEIKALESGKKLLRG